VTGPPSFNDDLNANADRKTEIAVRAPLIDGDFGKPIRILVPEGSTRRQIAEGPRALQHSTGHGKPCVGWQHRRPYAGHGVAEMIDVHDLAEVVRPGCPAICVILTWPAGGPLAAREHGGNRCEEVAAMKACRQTLGFQSMSQLRIFPARRRTSSNKPLPGPTYHRPSASRIMDGCAPPTPGSMTQTKTVPAGNHTA
jgi:hypothetical protein